MLLVIPFYLVFQYSRLLFQLSSIKNIYLMISMVLIIICKDCGNNAIILGTMQGIIILAVLPAFFVSIKPANKPFQNSTIYS